METFLKTDLLIIGGGPGGYVAALYAAKKGLSVTLVEKRFIGGTCLNVGCIPTKVLTKAAYLYDESKHYEKLGVNFDHVTFNWDQIQTHKDDVVHQLVSGIETLLKQANITVIKGTARFLSDYDILIDTDTETLHYQPTNIIIATGSSVRRLPIPGSDEPYVVDSEAMLSLAKLPKSLSIVGGGIIGMEFAFIFSQLGVEVNVIEMTPQILPMVDKDIVMRLMRYAKQSKINIITNAVVQEYHVNEENQPTVTYEQNGEIKSISSVLIFEAIGRKPNTLGLGLENTSILMNPDKSIAISACQKTNLPHVYAIGDVTNKMQLAHVASHHALIAVDAILGENHPMNYQTVPSVIFTHPAIATIGYSETELKRLNRLYRLTKVPGVANGKALINDDGSSLIKLIQDQASDHLIGAQIIGHDAEHLIATLSLSISHTMDPSDLKKTIFPHPTTSELLHEAGLGLLNESIHYFG